MPDITLSEDTLRRILQEAVAAALDERREFLADLVTEAIEDAVFSEAIREGLQSSPVSRDAVFDALGGTA